MKDKVQKIRKEVEKLMYGFNLEADIASGEDAEDEKLADIKYQLCKKILEYIDSLQEEPISEDLEEDEEPSICDIVDKHYWEMLVEEPVNELDKLRALSDGKPHLGWLDDAKEEEELEEAAYQYANCFPNQFEMASMAFIKGADWQRAYTASKAKSKSFEEQVKELWDEQNSGHDYIVVHSYNIFYGLCFDIANWQTEQMMKDAIEKKVMIDAGGYPYIDATELYDYEKGIPLAKAGDKVKVIIMK